MAAPPAAPLIPPATLPMKPPNIAAPTCAPVVIAFPMMTGVAMVLKTSHSAVTIRKTYICGPKSAFPASPPYS